MEKNFTTRTSLIIGDEGINKLKDSHVIVFGVGGVGSFAAEAIARAGVGNLTIVDFDDVDITNINRQLPALHSTVGKYKVDVMKDIISSMGMGNKLDPTKIEVTDIHKTTICPLARVMRKELKDRKIKKLKVVYSTEQPKELKKKILNGKKVTPGSVSFVPSVGGLIIASVVINDLLNKK